MEITKENSIIIADIKGAQLEHATEQILLERFIPFEEQAIIWMEKAKGIEVTDASQVDKMLEAREARLGIRAVRIGIDKTHKALKEDILKKGRTLDKIKNKLTELIEPIEDVLQAKEDFVKLQEQAQKNELISKRKELLRPYVDEIILNAIPLSDLTDDAFSNVLAQQKFAYEARIEAERKASEQLELEKIAHEREENRVRQENEKLRIENEKQQKKLDKERAERKRLETEQKEREEKEERERKERQAAERKLKRGPDKDKLLAFSKQIGALTPPQVKDEEAQKIVDNAMQLLLKVEKYIDDNAEKL